PARPRDQRQGDLDRRPDARLPQPEPVTMKRLVATTALLALAGCASVVGDVRPFEPIAPPVAAMPGLPAPAVAPVPTNGSIYAASAAAQTRGLSLFEDNKARYVGDLLTIVLVESTSSRSV